jgi:hypothetical protein
MPPRTAVAALVERGCNLTAAASPARRHHRASCSAGTFDLGVDADRLRGPWLCEVSAKGRRWRNLCSDLPLTATNSHIKKCPFDGAFAGLSRQPAAVTAVNSLINGGHGHDTFVLTGSFGLDTITNFSPAHDNIVLAQAMFANFGADITQVGANTVMITSDQDPANVITLTDVKASSLHASDFKFV